MCDPASSTILIGLTAAQAAVSMAGQYVQGQAASTQARYEHSVATRNAGLAREQAQDEAQRTDEAARRRYRDAARLQGNQQAAMAANGIDLDFGSAIDVVEDTRMYAREDVGQIYSQGFQNQRGYLIDAENYRMKARAAKSAARGAELATAFGMAGTALGAASSAYRLKSSANFGGG